mmetsp:Transcript_75445/g.151667  ORF Transcript_75445/g.151667 Transcript_75445/m.151667 type:complete len:339 (-) Transcript_75445:181-1197(-)
MACQVIVDSEKGCGRPRNSRKKQKLQHISPLKKDVGSTRIIGSSTSVSLVDEDEGSAPLRARWGVVRTYTGRDSWNLARMELEKSGAGVLESRDVAHTGCCKAYSIVALVDDDLGALVYHSSGPSGETSSSSLSSSSLVPPAVPTASKTNLRKQLDVHVRVMRKSVSASLTAGEWALLKSKGNSNRSGYTNSTSVDDAKLRVSLSYDSGRSVGHSMSPVWLEEWETSVLCRKGWHFRTAPQADAGQAGDGQAGDGQATAFVAVELHDACASNAKRSHFQVILPSPSHVLSKDDVVIILRRMQCHYNPVWVNGVGRHRLGELPRALTDRFFPEYKPDAP